MWIEMISPTLHEQYWQVCLACQVSLYNLALRVSVIPQRKPQIILSKVCVTTHFACYATLHRQH